MSSTRPDFLQVAQHRLAWAKSLIETFEREATAYLYGSPFQVERVTTTKWGVQCVRWKGRVLREPPFSARLTAADAVHNLRATANCLVWGCGQHYGATEYIDLKFRKTKEKFEQRCQPEIDCLPSEVQHWIWDQQSFSNPPDLPSPLDVVNRIWNNDKHRTLALMAQATSRINICLTEGPKPRVRAQMRTFNDGDTIVRAVQASEAPMTFEPTISCDLAFEPEVAGSRYPARRVLRDAFKKIRDEMLPLFERIAY